ncbi:MAG: calcium/proton exchanger [Actinobacteria bacterium 13_2_20CM_2_66_6]|nr:MAG: calcium/proton exchanger [Actinobacteria bacterium 13_2_20CM_2_66_6]
MGRKLLWASLILAPVTFLLRYVFDVGDVVLFVSSAIALIPLAWLIGEATEHAGEHTGPGIGGFLNASFGNAPELIIALLAVNEALPNVVRGSLMGSVVSNILLVLGVALLSGPDGARLDRLSLLSQLGLVLVAVLLFLVPSVPGWHGDPERHSLAVVTIPVAVVLLLLYVGETTRGLRRHKRIHEESGAEAEGAWTLSTALGALAAATVVTAFVSEILVHSLQVFANTVGLSEFFVAAVIVAIVGNAAEHGGAIVIARRGKLPLATEIAASSSAQVALLVTPAVALLSWVLKPALPLTFRPIELAAMGGSALIVAFVLRDGRSRRWEGALLVGLYAVAAVGFLIAGDR